MQFRRNMFPLLLIDLLLLGLAWWIAFWLRFNLDVPPEFADLAAESTPWMLAAFAFSLLLTGVYRQVWRYIGLHELRQLALGVALGSVLAAAAVLMLRFDNFPRSVFLLQPLLALLLLGAARASWRWLNERSGPSLAQPLLIVGSLQEATDALRALKGSTQWLPVGIVSPNAAEQGHSLQGVRVMGAIDSIAKIANDSGAATVLIASPAGSIERREVLKHGTDLTLLTMPHPGDWLQAERAVPRKVELEDLLGRAPVQLDASGLAELLSGKTVLVTGAGGSIGSELCRQIARFGVGRLVCVDVSEIAIYRLEQELREAHPLLQGFYYIANVREFERLLAIAQMYRPAVVFHAAACKHVPLMEELNEIEAVRTNVMGTMHAARAAGRSGARRFVLISTDKAVNPTNIMGATKRMAELVVQSVAPEYTGTEFVSVRFGNVLGSSGSVVPLFTEQILRGGPITVTHPEIVRYFMTIPEAAQLVLQAGLMGRSGQIYVLDMGEPVKIVDLARIMIRLSGKTERDIPLSFTGLRPGEKLFEELLADDETTDRTPHPKLRIAKSSGQQAVNIQNVIDWIDAAGPSPEGSTIRAWLSTHLPEYKSRI